jgi:hypothetical protein
MSGETAITMSLLTNIFDTNFSIRIGPVFSKQAKRALKRLFGRGGRVSLEKYAPAVVMTIAYFAFDRRIVSKVRRPTSANAARAVNPIIIDILAIGKLGATALPGLDSRCLNGQDTMKASKVKTV